uniref:Uncharacterized protein n=1 Tax=Rhizophora mucronata TaxID=61149 RepID=A0A2P2Q6D8_RHIMU
MCKKTRSFVSNIFSISTNCQKRFIKLQPTKKILCKTTLSSTKTKE